ncbi:MAG: hypothetical protein ACM3RP_03700 [Chitinophagales bacterium]
MSSRGRETPAGRLAVVAACLGVALLAWTAPGRAQIAGSPHDFRNSKYKVLSDLTGDELCKACHVPHRSSLPNRLGQAHLMRDFGQNQSSGHITMTESLLCMSCHDGTIAPFGPTGEISEIKSDRWVSPEKVEGDKHFWNDPVPEYDPARWSASGGWDPNANQKTVDGFKAAMRVGGDGKWVAQWPLGSGPVLPLFTSGDNRPRLTCLTCHDPHGEAQDLLPTGQPRVEGGPTQIYFLRAQPYGDLCVTCHSTYFPQ